MGETPGVALNRAAAPSCNVRSLKKQLGSLRASVPALTQHDIVSFSETWLNDNVADYEPELGFDSHTWFRRYRGSLGGGVAYAVKKSLLPVRLSCPTDAEMLLIRLQRASLTIAVCYRPPDDGRGTGAAVGRAVRR